METDGWNERQVNSRLFGIDKETLWKAVTKDIPPLKKTIQKVLKRLRKRLHRFQANLPVYATKQRLGWFKKINFLDKPIN